ALEQRGQLCREVFDGVGAVRHRRPAVAGKIVTDERQLARQRRDEIPEVPIDAEAVQQHEARAGAAAMQRDGRVEYHGRLSPDALSCAAKATALGFSLLAPAPG